MKLEKFGWKGRVDFLFHDLILDLTTKKEVLNADKIKMASASLGHRVITA